MKNKNNIQETQKFNPPTTHDAYMDGKYVGTCRVYDPPAWRNKNQPRAERPAMHKTTKSEMSRKSFNTFDNPIPGRV